MRIEPYAITAPIRQIHDLTKEEQAELFNRKLHKFGTKGDFEAFNDHCFTVYLDAMEDLQEENEGLDWIKIASVFTPPSALSVLDTIINSGFITVTDLKKVLNGDDDFVINSLIYRCMNNSLLDFIYINRQQLKRPDPDTTTGENNND